MAPPTPSSHRPRKKRKFPSSPGSNNSLIVDTGDGKSSPAFPLVSFLWAARAGVSQWLILPLTLMAVGLFRWAVSLWGYSGTRSTFWDMGFQKRLIVNIIPKVHINIMLNR